MSLGLLLVSPLAGDVELEVTSQNSCNTSFLRIVHELLAALEITTSPTLNSTVGTFSLRLANFSSSRKQTCLTTQNKTGNAIEELC